MSLKTLAPSYLNRLRTAIENAGSGRKALNIGCGDGEYDLHLSKRFESITGLDINRRDLSIAVQNRKKNSRYLLADGRRIPFRDRAFDCVICIDVLEHTEDYRRIISEIHRVLRKGSRLVISVPSREYPFTYDPLNFLLKPFGRHAPIGIWGFGHLRLYRDSEFRRELEKAGFRVEKTEYLNHYLAGLCENYLSTLFQGTAKAGNGSRRPGSPPKFLVKLVGLLLRLDNKLFKNSRTSIGLLIRAKKV